MNESKIEVKDSYELSYSTQEIIDNQKIEAYYGIDYNNTGHQNLIGEFEHWIGMASVNSDSYKHFRRDSKGLSLNRFAFDLFLNANNYTTINQAAARLGLDMLSLRTLIVATWNPGSIRMENPIDYGVVQTSIFNNIHKEFESLRGTIFHDHTSYCDELHEAAEKKFKFKLKKRRCIIAEEILGESDYSFSIDIVTNQPISIRHRVPLNNLKPIILEPDHISSGLYQLEKKYFKDIALRGPIVELTNEQLKTKNEKFRKTIFDRER